MNKRLFYTQRKITVIKGFLQELHYFYLLCLILLFTSCQEQNNNLKYTFTLNKSFDGIDVTMVYKTKSKKDTLTFLIPSSYDRMQLKNTVTVENIDLISGGELIYIHQDTLKIISNSNLIKIKYSVPSLNNDNRQLSCVGDDLFIPHVNNKFFHMYGGKSLIIPNYDITKEKRFDIEVFWKNFPINWHIANDFGISEVKNGKRSRLFKTNVLGANIGNSLFFGGKYRKTKFTIDDKVFYLFLYGEWKFKEEKLISSIKGISKANLKLWNHFNHSNEYVISVIQKGINDCGRIGGRNMFNSFVFYLPGKFTDEHFSIFNNGLAHEFTHTWIGVDLVVNNPNPAGMKWVTEGFTEYYANRINVDAGIINNTQYLAQLNQNIKMYMLSPYRTITNSQYSKTLQFDERLENYAYYQGAVFAFYLDGYLKEKSDNKVGLDEYLKVLFSKENESKLNQNINNEVMNSIAEEAFGISIAELIDKHIVNGESIPISSPVIDSLKTVEVTSFQYGFDYVNSINNEQISGVIENSNAYINGLRNGQKLLAIKHMTNNPKEKMILKVSSETGAIDVEFNPQGPVLNLPIIMKLKN